MNKQEFSSEFDTRANSYAVSAGYTNQDKLAFDEYEKSVFLTNAQEEEVISLYTGKNPYGESFEQTEELRRYLANLVAEANPTPITTSNGNILGMDSSHKFFTLPDGNGEKPAVWFITYESVKADRPSEGTESPCGEEMELDVYPVTQDEYHKIKRNPFRGANSRRALRLDLADGVIEIVSKYNVKEYYVRYLRRPKPIILEVLPDGLTIGDGAYEPQIPCCELHEALHQRILERAVVKALQSRGINLRKSSESGE